MFDIKYFESLSPLEKENFLKERENALPIFSMLPPQISMFIKTLDKEHEKIFVKYVDDIVKMPQVQFMTFLNLIDSSVQKELFDTPEMMIRLMELPKNKLGHYPYEFLNKEVQYHILKKHQIILEKPSYLRHIHNLTEEYQERYFESLNQYIKDVDNKKFEQSSNDIVRNLYKLHHTSNFEDIKRWFLRKFDISKNSMCGNLFNLIPHNQANLAYALTLKTEKEWLLYFRFGLYFPELSKEEEKLGIILDLDLLESISVRDIKHIYKELISNKENAEKSKYESLVLSIQLYSTLGLDNALKVAKGNFTKLNPKVLETAATVEFTNARREYRIKHQEYFYSHELLQAVDKNLKDENYELLGRIFQMDNNQIEKFTQDVFKLWKDKKAEETWTVFLAHVIKDTIKERENQIQKTYIKEYKDKHTDINGIFKQEKVNLYKCFRDVDITKAIFNEKGKPVIKKELAEFLLGNEKYDNDCVLRMVLNGLVPGLNQTLSAVINNFDMIYHMIEKSNGKMNIHSLLDVIDASKVLLYDLKPDEQDLSLETIAKIQNSRQHCTESPSVIIKKVKELHHERKKKVSSTIPIVKGKSTSGMSYEILNFDDEKLFTTGIDTGSCFKVGGQGGDFLKYCLTDKNGAVLTITGEDGKYYVCPIIRNGNSIFGNGIDPKPSSPEEMNDIFETIKDAYEKISLKSNSDEPIEMGVITDLHCKEYFLKQSLDKFDVDKPFMIGDYCYSDYYKENINNYIIYKSTEDVKIDYYDPIITYYQPRPEPFTYISSIEKDKERIEIIINSVGHTLFKLDRENNKGKKYKPYSVDEFTSIIGNKDWFVGFKKNSSIESHCLPYDKRARQEMYKALSQAEVNIEFQENMKGTTR